MASESLLNSIQLYAIEVAPQVREQLGALATGDDVSRDRGPTPATPTPAA